MKTIAIILLLSIFLLDQSEAQIKPSLSNIVRYGSGQRTLNDTRTNFVYRENLTDIRFGLSDQFTAGFRLLYGLPPETGQSFKGLSRKFVEYRSDNVSLRAGNYSELFGRGLVLNLFENRGLAYDTWAEGLKAGYTSGKLKVSLVYGAIDFADSINFWRTENYVVSGGNIEYELFSKTNVGISFIEAEGRIPSPGFDYNLKSDIPEFYFSFDLQNFNWFINWSQKRTRIKNGGASEGSAIYSSLSFQSDKLGILLDYKNYSFDERDPFERNDFSRPTRMLPFQNPPTVQKEHSYIFLSRSIHEIDFNDEVGFQLEVFYSLYDETFINFNGSLASRHNKYDYDPSGFRFRKETRAQNFIPSVAAEYSPFWEYLLEIENSLSDYTTVNLGYARRSKILHNEFTGSAGTHRLKSTVIPFVVQHIFNRDYSVTLEYEFESVFDNYNTRKQNYTNQFLSVIGNFLSLVNLNLRYELTSNKYDLSGKDNWFTVETGYRINSQNNISVSYGSERGGQTCSNGVCRYILPFDGIKVTLLSNL